MKAIVLKDELTFLSVRPELYSNNQRNCKVIKKLYVLISIMVFLSSCAPVISSEVLQLADKQLTFQDLTKDPEQYRGKVVVIGGRILSSSVEGETTWIQVLQQPLGWRQKPAASDVSYGRFLIHFKEYRDPEIFRKDRLITVAGEIEGKKVLLIDELTYTYPVVIPREFHIWKPEDAESRFHFGIGIGTIFR
jgi:outer membrane lipoprotein